MVATPDDDRNGVRLRGGLPDSNGLAPMASRLIKDESKITYGVFALRCAAITKNCENASRTASMKIVSLECDLTDEESDAIQLVLDRARVRRTGEEPLFDTSGDPVDDAVTPPTPIKRKPRTRR